MQDHPIDPALRERLSRACEDQCPSVAGLVHAHYPSLVRLAQRYMAREPAHHSLDPTALVHEAYLRLVDQTRVTARGYNFFRACVAQEFKRILVDHTRRAGARQRARRVTLATADGVALGVDAGVELLDLADALAELEELSPRVCEVVAMRAFAGMTIPECAEALNLSPRAVDKDWAIGRSWLRVKLT